MVINEPWGVLALRVDARMRHDFGRARTALERLCGVSWNAQGVPVLPVQVGVPAAAVGLADVLIASGERDKGERLLRASLADMDHATHDLKYGEVWHSAPRTTALALLGDRKATLAALKRAMANMYTAPTLWIDPALKLVSDDPEYQVIYRQYRDRITRERKLLDQMRADGRIPDRERPQAANP